MATREQVRMMQTAQPFAPFLVRMVDGRTFEVTHPELVSCSKDGRGMMLNDDDGAHRLEMLLVAEIVSAGRPTSAQRKAGRKSSPGYLRPGIDGVVTPDTAAP